MLGSCKFCGQVVDVDTLPGVNADDYAHRLCDCHSAKSERRVMEQVEQACKNVDELFDKDCAVLGYKPLEDTEIITTLKTISELCARYKIRTATLHIPSGGIAKIVVDGKGKVKVTRTVGRSHTLEA